MAATVELTHGKATARAILPILLIVASYLPLVILHVLKLMEDDRYRHVPLVLAAAAVLCWYRWPTPDGSRATRTVGTLLGGSLVTAVVGVFVRSPWCMWLAAILLVLAAFYDLLGKRATALLPSVLLLLLGLPLPLNLDSALVLDMQTFATRSASVVLDFVRVNHLVSGHIIEVPGDRFLVEEACSGVRSLFALLSVAAVFAVYERRTWWHVALLLLGSVLWSTIANLARVVVIVLAKTHAGVDLSDGWVHELLGICVFVFALGMLYCTDQLLLFWQSPRNLDEARPEPSETPAATRAGNRAPQPHLLASWPLALLVCLVIGLPSLLVAGNIEVLSRMLSSLAETKLIQVSRETLPAAIGDWTMVKFDTGVQSEDKTRGPHWANWTYRSGTSEIVVSFDYPFPDQHNLAICYRGTGWSIDSWQVMPLPGYGDERPEVAILDISKDTGGEARVYFLHFDDSGQVFNPPGQERASLRELGFWLGTRLKYRPDSWRIGDPYYQLQMMVNRVPGGDVLPAEIERLFTAALPPLMEAVSRQASH